MTVSGGGYWIWARDVARNNRHVWKGNGEVLPDNSPLWWSKDPSHGPDDCVLLYKGNRKLWDVLCSLRRLYICEAV